jgi:uncharacterized protein (UPF0218 family)
LTLGLPALILPVELRRFFANPRGVVVRDPSPFLAGAGMAVCVGDYVSRLCEESLGPQRSSIVFDAKTRRGETEPPEARGYKVVVAYNPAGTVTLQARHVICRAARHPGTAVRVVGEEDMLALAAMECARPGTLVLYGLPGRGTVVVRVSREASSGAAERFLSLRPGTAHL